MPKHTFYILAPKEHATFIKKAANAVAKYVSPVFSQNQPWACTFKLATNAEVQRLNHQFRGKDKPTNVLSFPAGEDDFTPPGEPLYLGDIIFAFETVEHEADAQKKPFVHHLQHLTVHGLLHLYGYDHLTDAEAEIMETLEISVLKTLNIPNPYENN